MTKMEEERAGTMGKKGAGERVEEEESLWLS
jgi:hypothetical protein